MSDKDKKDAGSSKGTAKKGKKKLLIIIVAAVALLAAGGGAFVMLGTGSKTSAAATQAAAIAKPGKIVTLDALTVNLAGGHYLKFELALQCTSVTASEAPDTNKEIDIVISEFADRNMADLSSEAGRKAVKADLVKKLNAEYPNQFMDVYFTQFVMQ
jgi:flagellar FliL protein